MQALVQLPYYLPGLLLDVAIVAVAGWAWPRQPRAAMCLVAAAALQLLASALSFGSQVWVSYAVEEGVGTGSLSMVLGGLGVVSSLLRAAGGVALLAGFVLAVAAAPGGGADPYGFKGP